MHIYSTGSCNGQKCEGLARVLIERDSGKTGQSFHYYDNTSKRCLIQGLIDGVLQLDASYHVVLVTSSRLALEKPKRAKGQTAILFMNCTAF